MKNPWLDIPLDEYERHMALPRVAQARMLADIFEGMRCTTMDDRRPVDEPIAHDKAPAARRETNRW